MVNPSEAFDHAASSYDDRYKDPASRAEDWALAQILKTVGIESPASRVLDLGCGTGNLLRTVNIQGDYLGIDPSRNMIAVARRNWPQRRFSVQDRPFPGARFSVIFAGWSLCFAEDPAAAFKMVRQALAPGGWFVSVWPGVDGNRKASTNEEIPPRRWDQGLEETLESVMPGAFVTAFNPWGDGAAKLGPLARPILLYQALRWRRRRDACHILIRWRKDAAATD